MNFSRRAWASSFLATALLAGCGDSAGGTSSAQAVEEVDAGCSHVRAARVVDDGTLPLPGTQVHDGTLPLPIDQVNDGTLPLPSDQVNDGTLPLPFDQVNDGTLPLPRELDPI